MESMNKVGNHNMVYVESCYIQNQADSRHIKLGGLDLVSVKHSDVAGKGVDYFVPRDSGSVVAEADQDKTYINIIERTHDADQPHEYRVSQHSVNSLVRQVGVFRTMRNHSAFTLGIFNASLVAVCFGVGEASSPIALGLVAGIGILADLYLAFDFARENKKYKKSVVDLRNAVKENFSADQQRAIMTASKF